MTLLNMESVRQSLKDLGLKLTYQRQAIISILLEKKDDHMSAEEVFLRLKPQHPEIGLATVYRTLEMLTDIGILYRVSFEDGVSRYDFMQNDQAHLHHHLQCTSCGSIQEIHEDLLTPIEGQVEERFHFQVTDHRLTFLGLCQDCVRKGKV